MHTAKKRIQKRRLAKAVQNGIINKNNYEQLKSLIAPNKSINNLYSMNLNNLRKEYLNQGFINENVNKNKMILSILNNGAAGVSGRGKISNTLINAPPAKGVCRSGRMQITGTCWFQSTMNPFLLSDIGRDILATKLAEFKRSNKMKKWTNINACPLRVSGVYFWSYIEYKLKENYTNKNEYKRVMKGEEFTNERLIRNIKLKNNNDNINGGKNLQLFRFLMQLFKEDHALKFFETLSNNSNDKITPTSPLWYIDSMENEKIKWKKATDPLVIVISANDIKNNFNPSKIINAGNYRYKLFGAYLKAADKTEEMGHAMTGYLCGDGNYMFYDSNNIRTVNLDWTTKSFWNEEFKKYTSRYFNNPDLFGAHFWYVRTERIPTIKLLNFMKLRRPSSGNNKPSSNGKVAWYKKLFKKKP